MVGWLLSVGSSAAGKHRSSSPPHSSSSTVWDPLSGNEKTYDTVEPRTLVALRLVVHLVLARAELPEILCGARYDILEQLERDPTKGLSCVEAISSAKVTSVPTSPPLHLRPSYSWHKVYAG